MPDAASVLMLDNHDSFTFNLVDAFAVAGASVEVVRNDHPAAAVLARAEAMRARLIVLSPGPGRPTDAGCLVELVRLAAGRVPLFGVCLGHQAIVEAFGGVTGPAPEIVHGKATVAGHIGHPLFAGVPRRFRVGRYHSLVGANVPDPLEVIARDGDVVMAVAHRSMPIWGVQFHPESMLTASGGRIIENVVEMCEI